MSSSTPTWNIKTASEGNKAVNAEFSTVDILGVPVARATLEEAVEHLLAVMDGDRPYLVFTPNPEMVDACLRRPEFAAELKSADLLVADGVGILWASWVLSDPLPGTVPGVDLLEELLRRCSQARRRVFLLGTTREAAGEAARAARSQFSGIRMVGVHHGFFSRGEEEDVVKKLSDTRPHLVVCGMGVPREQRFLTRHRRALPPAVYLGVGGALDVLAGRVRRAPPWMRRLGLEWLYRLVRNPARYRRQLALPRFVMAVLRERFGRRPGD